MPKDPGDFLLSYLPDIDRGVDFVSQKYRLSATEKDDLRSLVYFKMIENDYAVIRAFEGRCSPGSFFVTVIRNIFLDERVRERGKWRPSAEAKRLGPVAVELERLLCREQCTLDEAAALLMNVEGSLTRDAIEALAGRLPPCQQKREVLSLEVVAPTPVIDSKSIESDAAANERHLLEERINAIVNEFMKNLPDEDCVAVQLQFEDGVPVAQIARMMCRDQKHLYRKHERRMKDLRKRIESAGISTDQVKDLLDRKDSLLAFLLGKNAPRPSKDRPGETKAPDSEEP